MKRWLFFVYGLASYGLFFAVYAYLCAFTAGVFVPNTIDAPGGTPVFAAVTINLLLLLGFGLQHSLMARPAFKRIWTRIVPQPIERSTYCFASSAALMLLMWQWRPLPAIVWHVDNPIGRTALWALFAGGWLLVPAVSLMISHFDLFGVRQVWLHLRGREDEPLPFRTPMMYAHVRHPLYIGWALAFWATPTMTVGHLLFAVVMTGYMALATLVEERDLVAHFGRQYEEYRAAVPKFIPRLKPSRDAIATTPVDSTLVDGAAFTPRR